LGAWGLGGLGVCVAVKIITPGECLYFLDRPGRRKAAGGGGRLPVAELKAP
jgi:hypothetical protein